MQENFTILRQRAALERPTPPKEKSMAAPPPWLRWTLSSFNPPPRRRRLDSTWPVLHARSVEFHGHFLLATSDPKIRPVQFSQELGIMASSTPECHLAPRTRRHRPPSRSPHFFVTDSAWTVAKRVPLAEYMGAPASPSPSDLGTEWDTQVGTWTWKVQAVKAPDHATNRKLSTEPETTNFCPDNFSEIRFFKTGRGARLRHRTLFVFMFDTAWNRD